MQFWWLISSGETASERKPGMAGLQNKKNLRFFLFGRFYCSMELNHIQGQAAIWAGTANIFSDPLPPAGSNRGPFS